MKTFFYYTAFISACVVAREIPPEYTERYLVPSSSPEPMISFKKYLTPEEMDEYVEHLGKKYPNLVTVEKIGSSVEGRPITAVKISSDPNKQKPIVFIDAGIHAREWIAPAAALFILNQLVEHYEDNRKITDSVDWIVVPLVNPDGYHYSMTEDRFWRKNRANTTDKQCQGVDLNRNFDVYFGGMGTSSDPCEEIYAGPHAFSEPESRAIRDLAVKYKNRMRLYLTLHSYGQFFLYPWGYDYDLPKDWKELQHLASKAEKALSSVYGTRYRVGSSGRLMGAAAGGSDDWMKGKGGAKYSYTIELPGGGNEGFDLPPSEILPAVTELFPAVQEFAKHVSNENQNRNRIRSRG